MQSGEKATGKRIIHLGCHTKPYHLSGGTTVFGGATGCPKIEYSDMMKIMENVQELLRRLHGS